jgi:hypothetical protein
LGNIIVGRIKPNGPLVIIVQKNKPKRKHFQQEKSQKSTIPIK